MDWVVGIADELVLERYVYSYSEYLSNPANVIARNAVGVYLVMTIGAVVLYFLAAGLNYYVFSYLYRDTWFGGDTGAQEISKRKIREELIQTMVSVPLMGIISVPTVLPEFYGYSRLYNNIDDYGWGYAIFSVALFLVFTDSCIYWIHRGLHHHSIYRFIHKPHHAFITCSPFASHAFHFLDGYFQGLPYHVFVYLFPTHRMIYLCMFVIVNFWTVSIHDGVNVVPGSFVNGTAHHTEHHARFEVNYGQFFTVWDRMFGTYWLPGSETGDVNEVIKPTAEVKKSK